MTCEERRDLILLYAADALDADEGAAIAAHLEGGCPRCAGALAEAQAVMAAVALSADPLAAPAGVRERLMSRVDQWVVAAPAAPPAPPHAIAVPPGAAGEKKAPRRVIFRAMLIAACVAGLLSGLAVWFALRDRARLPVAPEVQYVALIGGETQPLARGRIFWDMVRHRWHVYVFDLKPPPPGRTYQLWLVTADQKKVPAGTLQVTAGGTGSLVVPLPQDIGPIIAAAITDEPSGGSPQPTGMIHLLGNVR